MAIHTDFTDPAVIPDLIAYHVFNTATGLKGITQDSFASVIGEVTLETQTVGPALLAVQLIDSDWKIQRSGLVDVDQDGLLQQVDINYPNGSDVWWRLAMVEGTNDFTQPNVTLTFQHRIVSYLQDDWGYLTWPPGQVGTTRAQFIKYLVDRIPKSLDPSVLGPGSPDSQSVQFVCPALNVVQPVQPSSASSTTTATVLTPGSTTSTTAKVNKGKGLGSGSNVTIQKRKPTRQQLEDLNTALGIADRLNAGPIVTVAMIYAGMGESGFNRFAPGGGIWQDLSSPNPQDVSAEATAWLTGKYGFQAGGGIQCAKDHPDYAAWQIANAVEANKQWDDSHTDSYASHAYASIGGQATGIAEAKAIIAAYGGASSGLGGTTGATTESDVSQLSRGTTSNPDEDSWSAMQRLASEVNWSLFTNPHPAPDVWGNYIYYTDGPLLVAQQPSLYIKLSEDGTAWSATDLKGDVRAGDGVISSLSYTFDNTAFQYQSTKKRKNRVQRKTKIQTPQTPSQLQFNMICNVLEYNAGDLFYLQDAGPLTGRWIVEDITHNTLNDVFAQFTLGPPTQPNLEPAATSSTTTSPSSSPGQAAVTGSGKLDGAARVAKLALQRQQAHHTFMYPGEGNSAAFRPINYNILTANPCIIDCSGFAIACYKNAGLPDPSNNHYNGQGYTGDMITHCKRVTLGDAQPGDFVFYGPPPCLHVTVYIGNGQVISMGKTGDPDQGPWTAMGPCPPYGIFRSNFASVGSDISNAAGTGSLNL